MEGLNWINDIQWLKHIEYTQAKLAIIGQCLLKITKNCFACGLLTGPIGDLDVSAIRMRKFLKEMLSELQRAKKQECEEVWALL